MKKLIALLLVLTLSFALIACGKKPAENGPTDDPIVEVVTDDELQKEEIENDITFIGKFLRKLSLDELPQLFNILKGDMSFVGPRPLIPQEDEIRKLREKYNVYSVRPGITGWAQVNGRDFIDDEQKATLDKEYVEKHSIFMDIKIMFRTVWVVLAGKDIADGNTKKEGDEK